MVHTWHNKEISCLVIFLQNKLEQRRKDDMETEIEKKVTSHPITSGSYSNYQHNPPDIETRWLVLE